MEMSQLIPIGLAVLAVVVIGLVAMPYLTGDIRGEKRQTALIKGKGKVRGGISDKQREANQRRKQIADSLKEFEQATSGKKRKQTLESRLL
jgi:hypothetical protein